MKKQPAPPIRLTREQAVAGASAQSASKGEDYAQAGAVYGAVRQGDMLKALVAGSADEPYEVTVALSDTGVRYSKCSCPYDWGGDCNHIVAVRLTWVDHPDAFVEQQPLDDLLMKLDAPRLRQLFARAADEVAGLERWLRAAMPPPAKKRSSAAGRQRSGRSEADVASYVAQIRRLLAGAEQGRGYTSDVPELMEQVLVAVRKFVARGDGASAVTILLAMCEPLVQDYELYEGECEVAEFLEYDVAPLLADAVTVADMDTRGREALERRLSGWDERFEENFGITPFEVPRQALKSRRGGR